MNILVTGAGGFIGGHLVRDLLAEGHYVRAVDWKPLVEWHQLHPAADNVQADLSFIVPCYEACEGIHEVYNLAADMGGIGFIEGHKAECMLSVLISTHMLLAAKDMGVGRFFYSSSACAYPAYLQIDPNMPALKESDVYPAMPEDGYGWEKLFTERMCRHFAEDYGLVTRVARYHNVYGPHGTFDGGREKAPAAICRKVIEAQRSGSNTIEIWGDGSQTRSYMYIDDCVSGTRQIMASHVAEPINLGSAELVSVNELVDTVELIAGLPKPLTRRYKLDAPRGVAGRNSDNTMICRELGWEPSISLVEGLTETFRWLYQQIN